MRRLLDLRVVWRRMVTAATAYEVSITGPEGRHLDVRLRTRMAHLLGELEETTRLVNEMAPPAEATIALRDVFVANMSSDARAEFERLRLRGRLQPGRGGGRQTKAWKDRQPG